MTDEQRKAAESLATGKALSAWSGWDELMEFSQSLLALAVDTTADELARFLVESEPEDLALALAVGGAIEWGQREAFGVLLAARTELAKADAADDMLAAIGLETPAVAAELRAAVACEIHELELAAVPDPEAES